MASAGQDRGPPTTQIHHETATIGPAFGGALAALRAANMVRAVETKADQASPYVGPQAYRHNIR